jgi:hypothetical protein
MQKIERAACRTGCMKMQDCAIAAAKGSCFLYFAVDRAI